MARLLSDENEDRCEHWHDHDDCSDGRKRRRHRPIPIGQVTVNCDVVSFRTPGQAMNVISCPVTEVLPVPITRTVDVEIPVGFGCFLSVPVTETFTVPVSTTVNVPPVITPVPTLVCPPFPFGTGLVSG